MKGILKNKLKNGEICLGHWNFLPYPEIISIIGLAEFDFTVIDMEHSFINLRDLPPMISAAENNNLTALVRVPYLSSSNVLRALDSGAHGIVIPHCNNKEDANKTVQFSKYSPIGERGIGKSTRSGGYSNDHFSEYLSSENETSLLVFSLESVKSSKNLFEILEVELIDVIYLGIYDLSASLGLPGQTDHPKVLKNLEKLVKTIRDHGKSAGTFTDTEDQAKKMIDIGVNFITCKTDGTIIRDAYAKVKQSIIKDK